MISPSYRRLLGAAAFLALASLAGAAYAAPAGDTVTVTWVPVAPVPISLWAMAGIALAIVAIGFGFMRGKGFARYTAYGLGAALICASALAPRPALAELIFMPRSIASAPGTTNYAVSTCSPSRSTFTNNSGAAINFTAISDDGATFHTRIDTVQTTCTVGTPLAAAGACNVVTTDQCP